jgi:polyisoprenoid-binding protein YceI
MKCLRLLVALVLLPLVSSAADRLLKIDQARSYVDVDVKATAGSFTGRLENYDTSFSVDAAGKIKTAVLAFKFMDLKTGKPDRDAKMIEWLGGGDPDGKFEVGILALAPDGQGQVTGKLNMHGQSQRVEFPVNVTQADGTYTVTGEASIDYQDWNLKIIKLAHLLKVKPLVTIRFKFTGTLPAPPAE